MAKNIVVCCDGTANQVVTGYDTNVVRLCAVAIKDPERQVVYYGPGLGTMEAAGALTWFGRVLTRVAGLAFGYGIAHDISNAYAFIMATYEPGDRLYLFGFSRGAYTARAVASLLRLYGLLRVGNEALIPYLVRELLHFDSAILQRLAPARNKERVNEKFTKAQSIRDTFDTRPCKPYFVGVWDTVSSVGWIFSPTRIPYTANNPHIDIGRHALALDERRAFFIRNLWQFDPTKPPSGPRDIKEVWFAGVHRDVGGGYPEPESGLAKVAFAWMLDEAERHGLLVNPVLKQRELGQAGQGRVPPDPNAKMHSSMTWLWALAEFVPLVSGLRGKVRVNLFRRRFVPPGALIHESVFQRNGYHPPIPDNHRVEVAAPSPPAEAEIARRRILMSAPPVVVSTHRAARDMEVSRRLATPSRSPPRYIQQKSFRRQGDQFVEERHGYVIGQAVQVRISIGPRRDDSIAASREFPDHELPWDRDKHQLQVVFHEPRQFDEPMLREIELPRQGDSTAAEFVFTPRAGGLFEGRISVLHRGRVLQTVLLHTRVTREPPEAGDDEAGITLDDEVHVRQDLSDLAKRRQFDLAIVLNHTHEGVPTLTGVQGQRAWAKDLSGIEEPVRRINELISTVAYSVADYGDGLDKGANPALMRRLARVGANLYSSLYRDQLKPLATEGFDAGAESVVFLQAISARPDAVVPLEFLYDFNAPQPDSKICPQHREALTNGRCPDDCARRSQPAGYFCPMGFWGLKKVIERHVFDPKAKTPDGAQLVVQAEAIDGRNRLNLSAGALVAYSQEVKEDDVAELLKVLGAQLGKNVALVKDWEEWIATVKDRRPSMLVAFPHNEGREEDVLLEIGGKKLLTLGLPRTYVCASGGTPPVVFLLGCDVAGTAQDFTSHVRFFRQAGAAVVVSTIATVFGVHAVHVGEAIVARMIQAAASDKASIGEAIRDAKCAAMLDSVPMALCVVAFGDADWRL